MGNPTVEASQSDYTYEITDNSVKIIKYTGSEESVDIPPSIEGKTVAEISQFAFTDCEAVSINIPAGVEKIGVEAFESCKKLQSVTVDSNNKHYASVLGVLYDKGINELIYFPAARGGEYSVSSVVKKIGMYAFADCVNLTSVTLPSGVEEIADSAFTGCKNLQKVTISESAEIQSIGVHAFSDCTSLKIITIPSNVGFIGDYAFYGCTSLEKINVNSDNKTFSSEDGVLFDKNKTTIIFYPYNKNGAYIIPVSVKIIGYQAFLNCKKLTSITIPDGVHTISEGAFQGCQKLTEVKLPQSIKTIGSLAFSDCTSLKKINIPDGIEEIPFCTFMGCKSLQSIQIPNSVKELGRFSFSDCTSLTLIYIPNSVETIGFRTLYNCPKAVVHCFYGSAAYDYVTENDYGYKLLDNFEINEDFTLKDAVCVLKHVANIEMIEKGELFDLYDITKDGKIELIDAVLILQAVARIL